VLSESERDDLERMTRSHSAPHGLVRRAEIILASADGEVNTAIARLLGVSNRTVWHWRKKWFGSRITTNGKSKSRFGDRHHARIGRTGMKPLLLAGTAFLEMAVSASAARAEPIDQILPRFPDWGWRGCDNRGSHTRASFDRPLCRHPPKLSRGATASFADLN
jgi:hypothetical protein